MPWYSGAEDAFYDAFYDAFRSSVPCSYPVRSGDLTSVITISDFCSLPEWRGSPMHEVLRTTFAFDRELLLSLPSPLGHVRRIRFLRLRGRDFDDTDRSLATLVRPHLLAHLHALDLASRDIIPLTTRQHQLLALLAGGLTNGQIARVLGISSQTVRTHLQHIYARLGVTSRGEAVALTRPGSVASGRPRVVAAGACLIGLGFGIARALVNQVGVLVTDDRPQDALALAGPAVAELRQLGLESSALPILIAGQLTALMDTGEWNEADRIATRALEGLEAVDAAWPRVAHALILLRRGLFSRAAALIQSAAAALGDEHDFLRGTVVARASGELALWQGKFAEGRSAIERGRALLRDTDDAAWLLRITSLGARLEADAVDDRRLAGQPVDLTRAREALDAHVRTAREQVDRIERTVGCRSEAFHRLTELTEAEAARIADPPAPARWAAVASSFNLNPYLAAYARWRLAEALLARPETRTRARAPLLTAHQTARRLEAAPLLGKIVDLAARARIDLAEPLTQPGPPAPSAAERLGLSDRETEVLTLIGRGLSNAEIAEILFISPKTASTHVSHILRKLNVTSRVQAAAIAQRTGLIEKPAG